MILNGNELSYDSNIVESIMLYTLCIYNNVFSFNDIVGKSEAFKNCFVDKLLQGDK